VNRVDGSFVEVNPQLEANRRRSLRKTLTNTLKKEGNPILSNSSNDDIHYEEGGYTEYADYDTVNNYGNEQQFDQLNQQHDGNDGEMNAQQTSPINHSSSSTEGGIDFASVLQLLQHQANYGTLPNDAHDAFADNSPWKKVEVALKFNNLARKCELNDFQVEQMFVALREIFPDANLPLREKRNTKTLASTLDDYNGLNDDHVLTFECCPCGSTVYTGENAYLGQCSECNEFRYTPCYECRALGLCRHANRTPVKVIQYRTLMSIIKTLLETRGFVPALNHVYLDEQEGFLRDVSDGDEYKKQLAKMKETYNAEVRKLFEQGPHPVHYPVAISLLIGLYFDGSQLFKRHAEGKVAPVVLTILNLPFSFRSVVGAGLVCAPSRMVRKRC
jgi:hypothetical protein